MTYAESMEKIRAEYAAKNAARDAEIKRRQEDLAAAIDCGDYQDEARIARSIEEMLSPEPPAGRGVGETVDGHYCR